MNDSRPRGVCFASVCAPRAGPTTVLFTESRQLAEEVALLSFEPQGEFAPRRRDARALTFLKLDAPPSGRHSSRAAGILRSGSRRHSQTPWEPDAHARNAAAATANNNATGLSGVILVRRSDASKTRRSATAPGSSCGRCSGARESALSTAPSLVRARVLGAGTKCVPGTLIGLFKFCGIYTVKALL